MTDRTLGRIAALLRQAEGTDNEHEAATFMAAAQRLATLASVDLAVARAHTRRREERVTPEQRTITIGEQGKRGLSTYVQLFVSIAMANGITCDVARNSTYVYAYGFGGDIDVCEALYSSLAVQMVGSCERYLRSDEHRADITYKRDSRTGRLVRRPVHPTTARINFQSAFAAEVGQRLAEAGKRATDEATSADRAGRRPRAGGGPVGGGTPGVALALRQKELEIKDFYRSTSQARGTWRGGSAGHAEGAQRAGRREGRRAKLGGSTAIGGSRNALGHAG